MKKFFAGCCVAAMVAIWAGVGWAASATASHNVVITVEEVALLALNNTDPVLFTIGFAGGVAGEAPLVSDGGMNNSKYLWYTSIVPTVGSLRKITVHIDTALNIPPGFQLYVSAANPVENCGILGTSVTTGDGILLNPLVGVALAANVITEIGSGYTGRLGTQGVNLTYLLKADPACENFGNIIASAPKDTLVTYTLTQTP